jgi:hypothetical protein
MDDGCKDSWMDGWKYGWVKRWKNTSMGGCVHGSENILMERNMEE